MKKNAVKILFLIILFLAIVLRITGLDRSFIVDEFRTIRFAEPPTGSVLEAIRIDSYPPFSYLILSAWLKISHRDVWIRFLFVIFGVLSVTTVYLIGKELVDPKYALLAMFLMAVMPMQVWVSQYARGIAPAILFILLSTLFFLRLIKGSTSGGKEAKTYNLNALGYVASSAIAIYSFYFAFFIIGAQNIIYIILNRNRFKNILRWCFLQAILFILFLPWLSGFLEQLRGANIMRNFTVIYDAGFRLWGLPVGTYMRGIAGFLGLDQAFLMDVPVSKSITNSAMVSIAFIFLIAAICCIYLFIIFCRKIIREGYLKSAGFSAGRIVIFFSIFAGLPLVSSIILNVFFKTPITPRYFAISSAFLIFIYALILFSIRDKRLFSFIITVFVIISLVRLFDFTKGIIDYKLSANFIKNNIRNSECLLFIGGDAAYSYYGPLPENYIGSGNYMRSYKPDFDYSLEQLVDGKALRASLRPFKVLWIYQSGERMTGAVNHVLDLMKNYGYKRVEVYRFKNIEIFKYAKR